MLTENEVVELFEFIGIFEAIAYTAEFFQHVLQRAGVLMGQQKRQQYAHQQQHRDSAEQNRSHVSQLGGNGAHFDDRQAAEAFIGGAFQHDHVAAAEGCGKRSVGQQDWVFELGEQRSIAGLHHDGSVSVHQADVAGAVFKAFDEEIHDGAFPEHKHHASHDGGRGGSVHRSDEKQAIGAHAVPFGILRRQEEGFVGGVVHHGSPLGVIHAVHGVHILVIEIHAHRSAHI